VCDYEEHLSRARSGQILSHLLESAAVLLPQLGISPGKAQNQVPLLLFLASLNGKIALISGDNSFVSCKSLEPRLTDL
jgi:hypothetical protein